MAPAATAPLLGDRQQPSSNEECISSNCKKMTYLLIVPLIVLLSDVFTIYNFSSISNSVFQIYVIFHLVKALILIILCVLFIHAVNHPEKRDILWVGGIISGLLFIIGFVYLLYIIIQCASMVKCNEISCKFKILPVVDYMFPPKQLILKLFITNVCILCPCISSIMFPMFGAFGMMGVPLVAFINYDNLGR